MGTTVIRVRTATHRALKELAQATRRPMQEVLARAVEAERRRLYLDGLNADYAALTKDARAAGEFRKENEAWDAANKDGLEDD